MQTLFPIVLFGSIALFVVMGVASMLTRNNSLYDQIGQGSFRRGLNSQLFQNEICREADWPVAAVSHCASDKCSSLIEVEIEQP